MAKLALINREKKRADLVKKFAKRVADLKKIITDAKQSDEARAEARATLQSYPRNSSPTRQRNRCAITGRPRGTFRKFGLSRTKLREAAMAGEIPGLFKGSW